VFEAHGLKEYVLASEEWMLKAAGSALKFKIEKTKKDYVSDDEKGRHNRLMVEKVTTHGKFWKVVKNVGGSERTWQWLRGGHLKKGLEGFICAAHERVLKTRQYKVDTLKQPGSKLCRLCHKFNENVAHLSSGCGELSQVDYRRRHDKMGLRVYWELLGKYGLKRNPKWYEQTVESVRKSEDGLVEIWWDRPVAATKQLDHNRPDVVVIDKREGEDKGVIVDFSVPIDVNVAKCEVEKVVRYTPLNLKHKVTFTSIGTEKSTITPLSSPSRLSITTTSGRLWSNCFVAATGLSHQISTRPSSLFLTLSTVCSYHFGFRFSPYFPNNSQYTLNPILSCLLL
jgi:hypothetical protein